MVATWCRGTCRIASWRAACDRCRIVAAWLLQRTERTFMRSRNLVYSQILSTMRRLNKGIGASVHNNTRTSATKPGGKCETRMAAHGRKERKAAGVKRRTESERDVRKKDGGIGQLRGRKHAQGHKLSAQSHRCDDLVDVKRPAETDPRAAACNGCSRSSPRLHLESAVSGAR